VLAKLPGVSASGFSPGASRPVLRGFSDERVRVLEDGIGSTDASSASADHAVTIDPLLTDRIEVLRGAAVLLYGSQAIGGAVNVIGKRIPPRVPDEAVHLDAMAALDTAYDRRELGASADLPLGQSVAFHVDGSWRETGDLAIPGYAASDAFRASLFEQADEAENDGDPELADELREGANTKGRLPNSWTKTLSLGTGAAVFSGDSNLGVAFGYYDTSYGIPGLPGVGEEDVSIGMKKYRVDLRGVLDLGDGFFDRLQTRWGYSNYTHTEFEGDEVGTVFDVSGVEGRFELVQSRRGGWSGSIGGQYSNVDFATIGEEAVVPPNTTENAAVFAVQEIAFDPFELELGGRFEHTDVALKSGALARRFDTFSGSIGLSYALGGNLDLGLNFSRAARAPSAQELFADGPHVATQQFEIGNPALGTEGAWGAEAYLRGSIGPAQVSFSVYRNRFDGFIFLAETGAEEDGLPVFEFRQQDATHAGVEGEIGAPLYRGGGFSLKADLRGDYVRATLADGTPVPRIPPLSLLAGLVAEAGHFDGRAEVQYFARQDRIAPLETPTDGFAQVNLSLAWHPFEGDDNLTLLLQADNLLDAEGRRHASFTKEYVPLAGRNFRLSAKASF
jgi:iron complex outermembrane receptor protein